MKVPLMNPTLPHQLDAYAVPDRRRMLARTPRAVPDRGTTPTVIPVARPGWETGAPVIFPFHPLEEFLGSPIPFYNTYNIEIDNSNRVPPFSRNIGLMLEFVETLISIQPSEDMMRTLTSIHH